MSSVLTVHLVEFLWCLGPLRLNPNNNSFAPLTTYTIVVISAPAPALIWHLDLPSISRVLFHMAPIWLRFFLALASYSGCICFHYSVSNVLYTPESMSRSAFICFDLFLRSRAINCSSAVFIFGEISAARMKSSGTQPMLSPMLLSSNSSVTGSFFFLFLSSSSWLYFACCGAFEVPSEPAAITLHLFPWAYSFIVCWPGTGTAWGSCWSLFWSAALSCSFYSTCLPSFLTFSLSCATLVSSGLPWLEIISFTFFFPCSSDNLYFTVFA